MKGRLKTLVIIFVVLILVLLVFWWIDAMSSAKLIVYANS